MMNYHQIFSMNSSNIEKSFLKRLSDLEPEYPGVHWPVSAILHELSLTDINIEIFINQLIEKDLIIQASRAPECVRLSDKGKAFLKKFVKQAS